MKLRYLALYLIAFILFINLSCSDNPVEPTDNPPVVSIVTPQDNSNYNLGDTITLTATATDTEEGKLTDSSLVWSSDIDGQIGTGTTITISNLSENRHVISLIATDQTLKSDTVQITINLHITFKKAFGGTSSDYGYSAVELSDDKGYVITGNTASFGAGSADLYLVKTDRSGNKVWEKTFGGELYERGTSILENTDGSLIITGFNWSVGLGFSAGVYLVKTDGDGNLLWENTYGTYHSVGFSLAKTSDGGYIVIGWEHRTPLTGDDVYLVKIDSEGNLLWENNFGGNEDDRGYSVCETSDGGYIVTGQTESSGAGLHDIYLVKTDINGNMLWEKTIGSEYIEKSYSVTEALDGGFVITGEVGSSSSGLYDVYLIKTDNSGNLLWENTYGRGAGESVCETSDGGFVITGESYILKTDNQGVLVWVKGLGMGNGNNYSVSETSDKGFVITGFTESFGAGSRDVSLIKTDSLGNVY